MSISQRKSRTNTLALLAVAGGLLAAAPVLFGPDEATAAERKYTSNKSPNTQQALHPGGERGIIINYKRPRPK